MNLDFYIFCTLIGIGFIYILSEYRGMFYIYVGLLIAFVIVMRMDPKGVDFVEYYRYLKVVEGEGRYIKEFIYFSIGLSLYWLVNSEILTFILMDCIWLYILYQIQKEINLKSNTTGSFFIVILFTSFPLFFGYENIYRQLFAEIFSLYAFVIRDRRERRSNILFFVSVFMHNTALVMLPFLIIKRCFKLGLKLRLLLSTIVSMAFVAIFSYASQFKTAHDTGASMELYYLLIFILLATFFIVKTDFVLSVFVRKFPSIYLGLILMCGLIVLPIGMIAERMGMFFLVFVIADLYVYTCSMMVHKQKLARAGLLLTFSLPVLLFNSSRSML
jgi:hypothetical protein